RKNRCDLGSARQLARQILRTVHGKIDISRKERFLYCRGEQSFPPVAQVSRLRVRFITTSSNDFRFDRELRPFFKQWLFHHPCLGTRQFTTACSDYDRPDHPDSVASVFSSGKLTTYPTVPRRALDFRSLSSESTP